MSLYDRALDEFSKSNNEEKTKLLYAYFGLAIFNAQVLEETFSIMLYLNRIVKKQVTSQEEINEIIDAIENSKKTMGNFLNEVKQNYGLETAHITILEDVLNRRNFIVHKFFKKEITKVYSDIGKKELIKYLCDFIDDTKSIDSKLNQYYRDYKLSFGLSDERIEKLLNSMIETERKRDQA